MLLMLRDCVRIKYVLAGDIPQICSTLRFRQTIFNVNAYNCSVTILSSNEFVIAENCFDMSQGCLKSVLYINIPGE